MNISAAHIAITTTVTPHSVGELLPPKLNTSPTIEKPISTANETSPTVNPTVNPTYEKPVISLTGDTKETSEEAEKSTEPDAEQPVEENHPHSHSEPEGNETYTEAELEQISALKLRDAEVNAHERAHAAVGGQHAGTPSYSYKTGPDGVKYAVSGEVSIDTSRVPNDPEATLRKAQQIKAAALAPAEPSGQDRRVAGLTPVAAWCRGPRLSLTGSRSRETSDERAYSPNSHEFGYGRKRTNLPTRSIILPGRGL